MNFYHGLCHFLMPSTLLVPQCVLVPVIQGLVTNCPKTSWLKQQSLTLPTNLQFGQGCPMLCKLGQLTGAGGPNTKVAHSLSWQVSAGYGLQAQRGLPPEGLTSSPHGLAFLSTGLLGLPQSMVASVAPSSPRTKKGRCSSHTNGPRNWHSITSILFYCSSNH